MQEAGTVTVNCCPLVSAAGAPAPLHCTVVCDEKYPPTKLTPRLVPPETSVSGVTATTAGRDGTTVKPCGPERLPEASPFWAWTTSFTSPATDRGPAGIVTRNELAVMKIVGTATGGFPTITTSFELKFVPAR